MDPDQSKLHSFLRNTTNQLNLQTFLMIFIMIYNVIFWPAVFGLGYYLYKDIFIDMWDNIQKQMGNLKKAIDKIIEATTGDLTEPEGIKKKLSFDNYR